MSEELFKELELKFPRALQREFHPRSARANGFLEIRGRKLVDLSNWDFFNLGTNPDLLRAVHQDLDRTGLNAGASRLSSGTLPSHISCELRISQFLGVQRAFMLPTRAQAIGSLFGLLASEADVLFMDDHLIQSLPEGCSRGVRAGLVPFNASNLDALELEISKRTNPKRCFVLAESVSLLSGRVLELPELVEISRRQNAYLILDESAALGTSGLRGAGESERLSSQGGIFAIIGDLSYGVAMSGAFVAGSERLIGALISGSRSLEVENPLPSYLCTGIELAINQLELAHGARERLRATVHRLRHGLVQMGFLDAGEHDSPVICVAVGNGFRAQELAGVLMQRGFYCNTSTVRTSLSEVGFLRILPSVSHSDRTIDLFLQSLSEVYGKLPEE